MWPCHPRGSRFSISYREYSSGSFLCAGDSRVRVALEAWCSSGEEHLGPPVGSKPHSLLLFFCLPCGFLWELCWPCVLQHQVSCSLGFCPCGFTLFSLGPAPWGLWENGLCRERTRRWGKGEVGRDRMIEKGEGQSHCCLSLLSCRQKKSSPRSPAR